MSHSIRTPRPDSVLIPVAGLTLFAIASGYSMSLIPLSLGHFAIGTDCRRLVSQCLLYWFITRFDAD